jgi:glycosyltransferase involved in cell wall biosynthesis
MKVSIISKADAFGGGASKVAVDLAAALSQTNCLTTHYVGWAGRERLRDTYPAHVKPIFGSFPPRFAIKCGLAAQWILGIPEAVPLELLAVAASGALEADIIHVHDITEVLSPLSLLWLSRRKPLIWTLHDCSPFTAGCISPFDKEPLGCQRWVSGAKGCDSGCPMRQERHYPFGGILNGVPLLWREKRWLSKYGKLHMTAPSTWLAGEVERSILYLGRRPTQISNGIDVFGSFSKRDKADCRSALGLRRDRLVVALMAGHVADTNKGANLAIDALRALPEDMADRIQLICIGTPDKAVTRAFAEFDVLWAGYVQDQRLLSIMLSAADLLLYPSLADNQPLSVIEAMASGTPVFSYDTGGIAETVGVEAGVVVPRKNFLALAAAMETAIRTNRLPSMSIAARARAESHFSRERMAAQFIELYEQVLEHSKP